MTRHELNRILCDRFAPSVLPPGMSDIDKILRANQVADDFHTLLAQGHGHGPALATALMRGGYLSGRLGGPFDGEERT